MIEGRHIPYLIALPAKISLGSFSGERYFTVLVANGEDYCSYAPQYFVWVDGQLVGDETPARESDGHVAAKFRCFKNEKKTIAIVEVPDGGVIEVLVSSLMERPTPIHPPAFASYNQYHS